jgi:excisionase family DNA binding protein
MSEPAPDRILYSIPHAAQRLDLGVSTVWKLLKEGRLESVRVGRSRRILHASLVKLTETQEQQ